MKSFIFAAGLGTRLRPLTNTKPKALVSINGKPLIDYLLYKLEKSGCSEAIVNVHHFANQIVDYLKNKDLTYSVNISDESDLLRETGGALKHASEYLQGNEPFLVHNSDVITNVDLLSMYDAFNPDDLALLLVSERKTSRYLLFDDNDRLIGWTNISTGEVKSPYSNIDPSKYKMRAFAGVHVISPKILQLMKDMPEKFSIIDFYLSVADRCVIRAYYKPEMKMVDVGKFDTLAEIEKQVEYITA